MKFNTPTVIALALAVTIGGIFGYYYRAQLEERPIVALEAALTALQRECAAEGKTLGIVAETVLLDGALQQSIQDFECIEEGVIIRSN
jgi:uncharacterized membrane protein (UPF0136 family)